MTVKSPYIVLLFSILFLVLTFFAEMAEARRGGRGAGFSRNSEARGGSFSARSSAQRSVQSTERQPGTMQRQDNAGVRQGKREKDRDRSVEDRQEHRDDSREDWQEHRREYQEDRQDFIEDEHHDHWDNHWHDDEAAAFVAGAAVGVAVGTAASSPQVNYITTLPCTATATSVDGTTYYQCGNTWYSRGYKGDAVVYVVSNPPAGH
jgi:hypothetical protein